MPYMIALVLFQILVITHVVRTGRTQPWLFVVAFLPVVGSIAYFVVEILPDLLGGKPGQDLFQALRHRFDSEQRYRKLKDIALLTGTADAKRALAEECLELERYQEAAEHFEAAISGLHADDPALIFGLLHARVEAASAGEAGWQLAAETQQRLEKLDAAYKADRQILFKARIADGQGKSAEAEAAFTSVRNTFAGPEARVRLAHFLYRQGRIPEAADILQKITAEERQLPRHARRLNAYWFKQARDALKMLSQSEGSSSAGSQSAQSSPQ